jgi:hypothetical protein
MYHEKIKIDTEEEGFHVGGLREWQRMVFAATHVGVIAKTAKCRCHPKQSLTIVREKISSALLADASTSWVRRLRKLLDSRLS